MSVPRLEFGWELPSAWTAARAAEEDEAGSNMAESCVESTQMLPTDDEAASGGSLTPFDFAELEDAMCTQRAESAMSEHSDGTASGAAQQEEERQVANDGATTGHTSEEEASSPSEEDEEDRQLLALLEGRIDRYGNVLRPPPPRRSQAEEVTRGAPVPAAQPEAPAKPAATKAAAAAAATAVDASDPNLTGYKSGSSSSTAAAPSVAFPGSSRWIPDDPDWAEVTSKLQDAGHMPLSVFLFAACQFQMDERRAKQSAPHVDTKVNHPVLDVRCPNLSAPNVSHRRKSAFSEWCNRH